MTGAGHAARRVFLVRHGETEWNALERLLSFTDHPLSARGELQARHLGAALAREGIRFDHVRCSPQRRAVQTAELVLAQLPDAPTPVLDERLVEVHFGPLEGWTSAQVAADPAAAAWRAGADHPGVETDASTAARGDAVWADLPAAGTTLVVSHGRFLRVLLSTRVLGLPVGTPPPLRFGNCRPAIVDPGPPPMLVAFNAGPPLEG